MAAHISPLLQASIGDACPIIQRYKSFQLGMESWLALFKMSLENHQQKDDDHKVPVEETDDFLATNENLFNDTFKSGRKKPRLTALFASPAHDFSSFQRTHAAAVSSIEERLNQGDHRILALESAVGSAPEDSPQTSLRAVIEGLRAQLDEFGGTLTDLEKGVAAQAQGLKDLKTSQTRQSPAVSFASISSTPADIAALQRKVSVFRSTLLSLVQMVQALSARIGANPSDSGPSMQLLDRRFVPHTLFNTELANLKASVASLQRQIEVSFGGFVFRSIHDCEDFLRKFCPKKGAEAIYQCFFALPALLQSVGKDTISEKETNDAEVTRHKTGKTAEQTRTLAALASRTPAFLVRASTVNDSPSNADPLTGMPNHDAWDRGDGLTGLVPRTFEIFRSFYDTLVALVQSSCEGCPTAISVFLEMLSSSFAFMEKWFAKTTQFYNRTLINTYGDNPTAEQKRTAWSHTKIMTHVLFQEFAKDASCARAIGTDDPFKINALVFWATIQQHATMSAFRMSDFEGHSSVQPKVLDFLSHNAAPKEMLESLRSSIRQVQTSLATTHALATQAKSTADRALSTAGNQRGGGGGGGRGGRGAVGRGDRQSALGAADHV
jgi:hypothetical protein